jgi:hypothetical protein
MALTRWIGRAAPIAKVLTGTVGGTWATADTISFKIGGITITGTVGSTSSLTAIVDLITSLWNGTSPDDTTSSINIDATAISPFSEITATSSTNDVILTADTSGNDFEDPVVVVTSASGTFSAWTTTAANQGPNDWNSAENWDTGSVPVGGDDIVFDHGNVNVKYCLDQSSLGSAVTLRIEQGYTGQIGLPQTNADSSPNYFEYRDTYLKLPISTLTVGVGTGTGSGRMKLDCDGENITANIYNTGTTVEIGEPSLILKNTGSTSTVKLYKGDVGFCLRDGETGTIKTLMIGYTESILGDVTFRAGPDATLSGGSFTMEISGGISSIESATTSITITNGEINLLGSGTHASLNMDGGTVNYRSSGTLTQGYVGADANLDCSKDMTPRTFTNLTLYENSSFIDSFKTVTYTNPIQLPRTGVQFLTNVDFGQNITVDIASI